MGKRDPRELAAVRGEATVTDRAWALRLPEKARLPGVFDWDRGGRAQIFAGWTRQFTEDPYRRNLEESRLLLLREVPGGETRAEKEYVIRKRGLHLLNSLRLRTGKTPSRWPYTCLAEVTGQSFTFCNMTLLRRRSSEMPPTWRGLG